MSLREDTPGYIIERTAKNLKRAFQQTLLSMDADVTVDQWVVLDVVKRRPGLSQQEIGERTAKDKPTVTRILDRLEDKGYVERRIDAADRRKFGIHPTASGTRKIELLMPAVRAFRTTHFKGLDDRDIASLIRIMERINDNISAYQSDNNALLQTG